MTAVIETAEEGTTAATETEEAEEMTAVIETAVDEKMTETATVIEEEDTQGKTAGTETEMDAAADGMTVGTGTVNVSVTGTEAEGETAADGTTEAEMIGAVTTEVVTTGAVMTEAVMTEVEMIGAGMTEDVTIGAVTTIVAMKAVQEETAGNEVNGLSQRPPWMTAEGATNTALVMGAEAPSPPEARAKARGRGATHLTAAKGRTARGKEDLQRPERDVFGTFGSSQTTGRRGRPGKLRRRRWSRTSWPCSLPASSAVRSARSMLRPAPWEPPSPKARRRPPAL